jgi:hypothetical protein
LLQSRLELHISSAFSQSQQHVVLMRRRGLAFGSGISSSSSMRVLNDP